MPLLLSMFIDSAYIRSGRPRECGHKNEGGPPKVRTHRCEARRLSIEEPAGDAAPGYAWDGANTQGPGKDGAVESAWLGERQSTAILETR